MDAAVTGAGTAVRARSVLRERDLLIIAIASFVSVTGDTAAIIALGLRLHANGGGGWTIAALMLAGTVPLVFLAPVAGAWADRLDSRRAITVAVLVQSLCAGGLIAANNVAAVLVLLALLSAAGSIVNPATGALVPLVVGEERIVQANSVKQTAFVLGNLIGPAVGGALAGSFGSRAPLELDAVSFLGVAVAMTFVRTRRQPTGAGDDRGVERRGGLRVITRDPVLLATVSVLAGLVLAAGAVNVADIFLIKDALHTSDAVYGIVSACWMVGIIVGSAVTGRIGRDDATLLLVLEIAVLVLAAGVLAAGTASEWIVAAVAFVIGGIGNGGVSVASQTLIVRRTPEHMRGRVLGVVSATTSAALVIALVLGGALVAQVGPRATIVGCAVVAAVLGGGFFALTRKKRAGARDSVAAWASR